MSKIDICDFINNLVKYFQRNWLVWFLEIEF